MHRSQKFCGKLAELTIDNRWLQATHHIEVTVALTNYAMTWLGRQTELGALGVAIGCRAYKPNNQ